MLSAFATLLLGSLAAAPQVTTPEQHLGRPVGVDFELADWQEVSSYYQLLAGQSPRVRLQTVGTTTEGRDFLFALISSEANLGRLEDIRRAARIISDPRRASEEDKRWAVVEGRPLLFVSCAMHSTETAGTQFGMEFAHRLATSDDEPWASARDALVVGIFPCTNPDGLDEVVSWYRQNVGTPTEATGLTRLYQYYSGHDNNRDWFALTQAETRIVTRLLYQEWRPQIYWDVHQQGSSRERLFVPPFRDPLNPNLDPAIISAISSLGMRAVLDLTREGYSGVSTGVSYDMWWNGGNRNVPVRHNMIGLLTEAASVNIASPIWFAPDSLRPPRGLPDYAPSHRFPWPWPGGWWRLRNIIDYEIAFGRSLLRSLSREPELWLRNAMDVAERTARLDALDAPRAWIIPSDNPDVGASQRLAEILLLSGVELHVARGELAADGRSFPPGSIVIRREQPYSRHVKDLFEVQRYPNGEQPYDVAGWTLPLLFGVRRVEVVEGFEAELAPVTTPEAAVAGFPGSGASSRDSRTWKQLFRRLREGAGGTRWIAHGPTPGIFEQGGQAGIEVGLPRIGVYSPWSGSMDEGWLRWVLDTWGVPYVRVRNEMIRAGQLEDFLDVLLLPSLRAGTLDGGREPGTVAERYAGGLDPEGAVAVEEFVRGGGTLITLGGSSRWAVELFDLPLKESTRGPDSEGFSCPGSVLRTVPEEHALTAGLPASLAVFFSGSSAWEVEEKDYKEWKKSRDPAGGGSDDAPEPIRALLRYAPTRVLLSGFLSRPEVIAGKPAWLRVEHGQGRIHLFGFRPQYRGWSQGSFQLLFRAMLLDR